MTGFCTNCAASLESGTKFCTACGTTVEASPSPGTASQLSRPSPPPLPASKSSSASMPWAHASKAGKIEKFGGSSSVSNLSPWALTALAIVVVVGALFFYRSSVSSRSVSHAASPPDLTPKTVPGEQSTATNPLSTADAQKSWVGFANGNVAQDRDAELRRNCGDFKRVYVPDDAGNKFTDLCGYLGETCDKVCDWQGNTLSCDDVSQGGNRDGTRLALCR